MPKISVIVPVYKVEKYLCNCIESIIHQTMTDLEIILVDDGSPDRCGKICDEYAQKDNRIKVIHKKNEGLPAARNDGLKIARGKWIAFVDSDDWISADIYEKAYNAAVKHNPDFVWFNTYRHEREKESKVSLFIKPFVTSDRIYIRSLMAGTMSRYFTETKDRLTYGFPWDKLYSKEFLINNKLYYTPTRACEDMIHIISVLQAASKIVFIDEAGYHYRYNPLSIGHRYMPDRIAVDEEVFAELKRLGEEYKADKNYFYALNSFIVQSLFLDIQRCFFHKDNKKNLKDKLKYVKSVVVQEPYKTALENVDRNSLSREGKFVCIFYKLPLVFYLWHFYHTLKISVKEKFKKD